MAFIDDFSGEVSDVDLEAHTPSGGAAWTLVAGTAGSYTVTPSGDLALNSNSGYYTCDDQGSADQYVEIVLPAVRQTSSADFVACRMVDSSNFVGWYLPGSGGSGSRLVKRIAGTTTELVLTGSAGGSVVRIEAEGSNVRFYLGGVQQGATQTVADFSTETSQGLNSDGGGPKPGYITSFEAGALGGGTEDNLLADDIQSLSTVSSVSVGQTHNLLANDLSSNSELTIPSLSTGGTDNLLADDLDSATQASTVSIGQVHTLTADSILSPSSISGALLNRVPSVTFDQENITLIGRTTTFNALSSTTTFSVS